MNSTRTRYSYLRPCPNFKVHLVFLNILFLIFSVVKWLTSKKVKLATVVESVSKAPFRLLLHQDVREGATPVPGLLHFTLDPYFIMLSVKQGGIKYHFLSLWYDST